MNFNRKQMQQEAEAVPKPAVVTPLQDRRAAAATEVATSWAN
jgi:hypothetical protein